MFEIGSLTHILLCIPIPFIYMAFYKQKGNDVLLFSFSVTLFILEIIKQLYFIYTKQWTVWIVPFHLCSTPMYYFLFSKYKTYFQSYMSSFVLLGTVCALLYPEDMIHKNILLTFHSFLWHYILICMAAISKDSSFKKSCIIFFIFVCIATILNITLSPFGQINMFYINPLQQSYQPVFYLIGQAYGVIVQNCIYIVSLVTGSYILHILIGGKQHDHYYCE